MRAFLLACALSLAGATASAQQRFDAAMHASASERLAMLAERIGKSDLQVAQGMLVQRGRRALRDGVREFDALLPHVAALAADAEARDNFVLLALLWKELRAWALKAPTREIARNVSERAEEASWVASKGARLLKAEGTDQRSALAAMAAATLAQRVARLYLLERMGAADGRRRSDLAEARTRLAATLESLSTSPHAIRIDGELDIARSQHEFLVAAMGEYDAGAAPAAIESIVKTADNVADAMERAARLYENAD